MVETEKLRICFLIGIPILRFDAVGCAGRVINDLRFLERSGFFLVIFQSKERITLAYGDCVSPCFRCVDTFSEGMIQTVLLRILRLSFIFCPHFTL